VDDGTRADRVVKIRQKLTIPTAPRHRWRYDGQATIKIKKKLEMRILNLNFVGKDLVAEVLKVHHFFGS